MLRAKQGEVAVAEVRDLHRVASLSDEKLRLFDGEMEIAEVDRLASKYREPFRKLPDGPDAAGDSAGAAGSCALPRIELVFTGLQLDDRQPPTRFRLGRGPKERTPQSAEAKKSETATEPS